MKKIVIIISTICFILISCLLLRYFFINRYITEEQAKEIAINHVSNKNNQYTFNSIEFKETNDTYIYTLIFEDNFNLYTYKINAKTRKILSSKKESLLDNKKYLSEDEILTKVLNYIGTTKTECNITNNAVKLVDGFPIYNTIVFHNNIKYDFKVNAYTGGIISVTKLNKNAG